MKKAHLEDFLKKNQIEIQNGNEIIPYWSIKGNLIARLCSWIIVSNALRKIVVKLGVEAVHVNDARMMISWAIACRLAGIPLVVHQRTRFVPSRLSEFCLKQGREIIAISNFVRSSLPDCQKKKAVVIRNPFNSKNQPSSKRELKIQLNIPNNSSIILFVGTIQQQKTLYLQLRL